MKKSANEPSGTVRRARRAQDSGISFGSFRRYWIEATRRSSSRAPNGPLPEPVKAQDGLEVREQHLDLSVGRHRPPSWRCRSTSPAFSRIERGSFGRASSDNRTASVQHRNRICWPAEGEDRRLLTWRQAGKRPIVIPRYRSVGNRETSEIKVAAQSTAPSLADRLAGLQNQKLGDI